jgi:hypothetical protein
MSSRQLLANGPFDWKEAEAYMSTHSSSRSRSEPRAARDASHMPQRRQVLLGGAGLSLGAALGTSGLQPVCLTGVSDRAQ